MSENAQLQQSHAMLKMEEKQYRILRSYMEETTTLRHDFRQHLLTIEELAKQGNTEKLLEYIVNILRIPRLMPLPHIILK